MSDRTPTEMPEMLPQPADRRRRSRNRRALVGALVLWFGLTGAGIAYLVQGLGASYLAGLDPMVSGGLVLALIAIFGLISALIRALL
jgi:hypothetical protein